VHEACRLLAALSASRNLGGNMWWITGHWIAAAGTRRRRFLPADNEVKQPGSGAAWQRVGKCAGYLAMSCCSKGWVIWCDSVYARQRERPRANDVDEGTQIDYRTLVNVPTLQMKRVPSGSSMLGLPPQHGAHAQHLSNVCGIHFDFHRCSRSVGQCVFTPGSSHQSTASRSQMRV
jgi:hypothetical protein